MINLHQGDCLELMKDIPDGSVDMILCDLPYGTTSCKWDTVIPFTPLWDQYKRIIKDRGQIVIFATEPFTSQLVSSNLKWYREHLTWIKHRPSNFAAAKYHVLVHNMRPVERLELTSQALMLLLKGN